MTRRWIVLLCAILIPTIVQASWGTASTDTEELTYDDLVNELSRKNRRMKSRAGQGDPFETVKIHAGIASVSSFSTFVFGGRSHSRYQNGMQIAVGVDLFSDVWFAETAWRNFGETRSGLETHYLRELDLKIGYKNHLEGPWKYRLQTGLAQRHLRLDDPSRDLRIDQTMPGLYLSAGAMANLSPIVSMGFDVSGRSPVVGETVDKGSVDLSIELRLSL